MILTSLEGVHAVFVLAGEHDHGPREAIAAFRHLSNGRLAVTYFPPH